MAIVEHELVVEQDESEDDDVRVTFTIPRRVYEYWVEVSTTGEEDEAIREEAIERCLLDQG